MMYHKGLFFSIHLLVLALDLSCHLGFCHCSSNIVSNIYITPTSHFRVTFSGVFTVIYRLVSSIRNSVDHGI